MPLHSSMLPLAKSICKGSETQTASFSALPVRFFFSTQRLSLSSCLAFLAAIIIGFLLLLALFHGVSSRVTKRAIVALECRFVIITRRLVHSLMPSIHVTFSHPRTEKTFFSFFKKKKKKAFWQKVRGLPLDAAPLHRFVLSPSSLLPSLPSSLLVSYYLG